MDIYKADVLRVFGTHQAAADALGIGRTAVTMWPDDKPIPAEHALRLRYEIAPEKFKPRSGRSHQKAAAA
jgi:hypothetical protein